MQTIFKTSLTVTALFLSLIATGVVLASPIPTNTVGEIPSDERHPVFPVINFTVDPADITKLKSEIFYGPLKAGKALMITYDPARAKCGAGSDTWSVSLGYKSTTNEIHSTFAEVAFAESGKKEAVSVPAVIPPMPAGKFEVWFRCGRNPASVLANDATTVNANKATDVASNARGWFDPEEGAKWTFGIEA
ncbi:hypothetical protein HK102_006573 [Quaeritorhiza haematococci]|nr:hypothetical protein HK102_006573 [Quaeritorhiza haematococci]